ncbi:magnesium transporter CorA family protein [Nakamurella leprariae]|uniref:Magnesium transporter CorA family protein n=1 Tax=Nakamurella leprariae TaxID=2803911 RepID=A0A938YJ64_9ACTN|nr:magnesium transporter CorA family protein [Nakamurella leprariae]MBM9469267.1 magnesium transporter CorA family protein [Nakamurella leprariae]
MADDMVDRRDVRIAVWRHGTLLDQQPGLGEVRPLLDQDDALVWVDLVDPSPSALSALADDLGLPAQAVEDALSAGERSKVTRYAESSFLVVYALVPPVVKSPPDEVEPALNITRVSAFVLRRVLITVRTPAFDVDAVVQRWADSPELLRDGVGALVHGLLDVVVDRHLDAAQQLDDVVESLEDGLFDEAGPGQHMQRRTYQVRRNLVDLRRIAVPMRDVVGALIRRLQDTHPSAELAAAFDDLYDHAVHAQEWTDSLRDMLATIFETNLSLADARLNTVMKKLTGWAAIIAVPTAITGFFGQNVEYPGVNTWAAFAVSAVMIVTAAAVLFAMFKRRGWL